MAYRVFILKTASKIELPHSLGQAMHSLKSLFMAHPELCSSQPVQLTAGTAVHGSPVCKNCILLSDLVGEEIHGILELEQCECFLTPGSCRH